MQLEMWGFFAGAMLTGLSLGIVFSTYVYLGHTLTAEVCFYFLYLFLIYFFPDCIHNIDFVSKHVWTLTSSPDVHYRYFTDYCFIQVYHMFFFSFGKYYFIYWDIEKFLRAEEMENTEFVQTSTNNEILIENATLFWNCQRTKSESSDVSDIQAFF